MIDKSTDIVKPYVKIVLTAVTYPAYKNYATNSDEEELAARVSAFVRNQIIGYMVPSAAA